METTTIEIPEDAGTVAPLQSAPQMAPELCPVRDRCMVTTHVKGKRLEQRIVQRPRSETAILCGFEIAGTVADCPKRRKLEV